MIRKMQYLLFHAAKAAVICMMLSTTAAAVSAAKTFPADAAVISPGQADLIFAQFHDDQNGTGIAWDKTVATLDGETVDSLYVQPQSIVLSMSPKVSVDIKEHNVVLLSQKELDPGGHSAAISLFDANGEKIASVAWSFNINQDAPSDSSDISLESILFTKKLSEYFKQFEQTKGDAK